jgi:hypothetical protein
MKRKKVLVVLPVLTVIEVREEDGEEEVNFLLQGSSYCLDNAFRPLAQAVLRRPEGGCFACPRTGSDPGTDVGEPRYVRDATELDVQHYDPALYPREE